MNKPTSSSKDLLVQQAVKNLAARGERISLASVHRETVALDPNDEGVHPTNIRHKPAYRAYMTPLKRSKSKALPKDLPFDKWTKAQLVLFVRRTLTISRQRKRIIKALAGSVANMGHGRAASPSWGIRQHWRNAY